MKRFLLIIAICVGIVCVSVFKNNTDPGTALKYLYRNSPHLQDARPLKGNRLYQVNIFGVIPVGTLNFYSPDITLPNTNQYLDLTASARSLPWVSFFFIAKANLTSTINTQTLAPRQFKQIISLGTKKNTVKEVFYDQEKGIMTIGTEKRNIPEKTQDPLSLIYNLGKLDLASRIDFEYTINTNQKNYTFLAHVKPVSISVSGTTSQGYLVKADIRRKDKNNPYHRSKVDIFFLAYQHENIPLVINVFASGFFVNLKLISFD